MAKKDTIIIDTDGINVGLSHFSTKKKTFHSKSYATYKSSYLNTSGSSTVKKMNSKVKGLYNDLESAYGSLTTYTKDYLTKVLEEEKKLLSHPLLGDANTYVDADGITHHLDPLTSEEALAAQVYAAQGLTGLMYMRNNDSLNSKLNDSITATYANNKYLMGFLDGLAYTTDRDKIFKLNTNQKKTITKAKKTKKYKAAYGVGFALSLLVPGAGVYKYEKGVEKGIGKAMAKDAKGVIVNIPKKVTSIPGKVKNIPKNVTGKVNSIYGKIKAKTSATATKPLSGPATKAKKTGKGSNVESKLTKIAPKVVKTGREGGRDYANYTVNNPDNPTKKEGLVYAGVGIGLGKATKLGRTGKLKSPIVKIVNKVAKKTAKKVLRPAVMDLTGK